MHLPHAKPHKQRGSSDGKAASCFGMLARDVNIFFPFICFTNFVSGTSFPVFQLSACTHGSRARIHTCSTKHNRPTQKNFFVVCLFLSTPATVRDSDSAMGHSSNGCRMNERTNERTTIITSNGIRNPKLESSCAGHTMNRPTPP